MVDKTAVSASIAMKKVITDVSPQKIKIVQTDNGKEFFGAFSVLLSENNIEHVRTRPYNPQCNGAVEVFNKYIKSQLTLAYNEKKLHSMTFNFEK